MATNPPSPKLDYVPGADGMQPGDKARGRVTKSLEYRAGDGPLILIHPDHDLHLERAPQSLVISWQEDGQPMNADIPVDEFDVLLATRHVVIKKQD